MFELKPLTEEQWHRLLRWAWMPETCTLDVGKLGIQREPPISTTHTPGANAEGKPSKQESK